MFPKTYKFYFCCENRERKTERRNERKTERRKERNPENRLGTTYEFYFCSGLEERELRLAWPRAEDRSTAHLTGTWLGVLNFVSHKFAFDATSLVWASATWCIQMTSSWSDSGGKRRIWKKGNHAQCDERYFFVFGGWGRGVIGNGGGRLAINSIIELYETFLLIGKGLKRKSKHDSVFFW